MLRLFAIAQGDEQTVRVILSNSGLADLSLGLILSSWVWIVGFVVGLGGLILTRATQQAALGRSAKRFRIVSLILLGAALTIALSLPAVIAFLVLMMVAVIAAWATSSRAAIRRSDAQLLAVLSEREDALEDLLRIRVELESDEDEIERAQTRLAELEDVEEGLKTLKAAAADLDLPAPAPSLDAYSRDELRKTRARIESQQERVELLVEQSSEILDRIRPTLTAPVKGPLTMAVRGFMLLLIAGSVIGLSIDDTPWLPTEEIGLADGSVLTGYVLSDTATQLTVLVHSPRSARIVESKDVTSRQYCQGGRSDISRTLAQSVMRGSSLGEGYPFCTELVEVVEQDD